MIQTYKIMDDNCLKGILYCYYMIYIIHEQCVCVCVGGWVYTSCNFVHKHHNISEQTSEFG